jgi:hypothetical protein
LYQGTASAVLKMPQLLRAQRSVLVLIRVHYVPTMFEDEPGYAKD